MTLHQTNLQWIQTSFYKLFFKLELGFKVYLLESFKIYHNEIYCLLNLLYHYF